MSIAWIKTGAEFGGAGACYTLEMVSQCLGCLKPG